MDADQKGLIALLKSAVTGEKEALPPDFAPEAAAAMAAKQGVLCLMYQGAVTCGVRWDGNLMSKLRQAGYRSLLRSEGQMAALEKLFREFDARGIDYLPLKGCVLKPLYPRADLRPMGDADLLIRPAQFEAAAAVMASLGYTRKVESDHTDNWTCPELYVELHRCPVPAADREYYRYYGDGWHLAVHTDAHRFELSAEDHFLFLLTHFARHYRDSGIGCRHVLDLYVYLRAFPGLDEAYVVTEAEKLGLSAFYTNVRRLLRVWFEGETPDAVTELMTAFVFSGGAWGTLEAGMYAQALQSAGKPKNPWLQTLFPSLRTMQNRYDLLRKWSMLLPVMYVVRWFDVLLFSRENVGKKFGILHNMDQNHLSDRKKALEAVGIYRETE